MAELLTELELESGTDPAASRILRRRMALVLLAVSAVGTVAVLETYGRHGVTVRSMVILAGCVLVLTTVWVLGFRRGMAVGSFHRESTNFNLIAMAGWFGFRCLCLGLKLSLLQAMTLDMMVLAGLYALISYQFFPSLWWLVAGLAAGSVGALLRPQNAEQIFLALYSIWPFAMAYALGKRPQTRQSGRTAAARRGSPSSRSLSQPSG
jgi:hypothetical protein